MNKEMLLDYLLTWNEHEKIYSEYYEKKKNRKDFQAFLNSLDVDYISDNFILIPELAAFSPHDDSHMQEEWYFQSDNKKNVLLTKHDRCTPPFLHTHTFFEGIYVLQGSCEQVIDGKTMVMHAGDFCLVSPSVVHSIYAGAESLVINILIRRSNIEDIYFNVLRDQNIISDFLVNSIYLSDYATWLLFHTLGDEEMENEILDMFTEQFEESDYSDRIISSRLVIFFNHLSRKYSETAEIQNREASKASASLLHFILQNYDTISLQNLADHLGFSPAYCSRYIRKITGHSFLELHRQVRNKKAEHYLLHTSDSISTISTRLGYTAPENFMRAFHQTYGLTPGEYRSRAQVT